MIVNDISVGSRHNNPTVLSKVGLQTIFIQDGEYVDPYAISGVTIFAKSDNYSPCSILVNATQLIDESVSSAVKMHFGNSSVLTTDSAFDTSNYNGAVDSSGIYRLGTGKYIVILDGTLDLSGNLSGFWGLLDTPIANTVSAAARYIDAWSVQMVAGSELQVFINDFVLRKGAFTAVTEPLLLKSHNYLTNKKIVLGSKSDIKIATEIHVENKNIGEEVRNLLRDSLVTSAAVSIEKINTERNLPSRVTVSAMSDTSSLVEVLSDNTIMLSWDTENLRTHSEVAAGNLGSLQGTYLIRAQYTLLGERLLTNAMYLEVI